MNSSLKKIITIDGPAGAGKSTMARELARQLNWIYLDTGSLYRAVALAAKRHGVNVDDQGASENLAQAVKLEVAANREGTSINLDGENVTPLLRSPEISRDAAFISRWPGVREVLFGLQRKLGDEGEVVAEGRDMGTVVFPDAALKLFLYASPESRARRRFEELRAKGVQTNLDQVLSDIIARDDSDRKREHSPLVEAADALTIDSTNLNPDAVLKVMVNAFRCRFFAKTND